MQWNSEQLQAIELVDKNILVSASAGSGKTTVLVGRLMKRIIRDKISVDTILAMTFTEAAASEMKKRLLVDLNKKLEEGVDKEYIQQQLVALQNAHISTIHSFCLDVIKENFAMIGLDPNRINNILDDAILSAFEANSIKRVIEELAREYPEKMKTACMHFSARSEDFEGISNCILEVAKVAAEATNEEEFYAMCVRNYKPVNHFEDLPEGIRTAIEDSLRTQATRLLDLIKDAIHYMELNDLLQNDQYSIYVKKKEMAEFAIGYLDQHDYVHFRHYMLNMISGPTKNIKNHEYFKGVRSKFNDLVKEFVADAFSEEVMLEHVFENGPIIELLVEGARRYNCYYNEYKVEYQGIDFNDMEHLAYQILMVENGAVAHKYQKMFNEIMVDEFQDTNGVQDQIIRLISRGNNIFRVGDIKQSIYKFRGAKPAIMQDLMDHPGENDLVIYLTNNYRSKESIVEFNNDLFNKLMNVEGLSSRFTEKDFAKIGLDGQKEDNHIVEFGLCIEPKEKEMTSKQRKARYIADRIIDLRNTSEFKNWKDFAVLVRSHRDKKELKEAFDEANIPYFIDAKSGFFHSYAMETVLPVLKAAANREDEIAIVAALTSDLFKETDNTLAMLKLNKQKMGWMDYLDNINHPLSVLVSGFSGLSVPQMIQRVIHTNNWYENECDKLSKTNCNFLMEKAREFDKSLANDLVHFIHYIEGVEEKTSSESIPVTSDDDVVKVVTIHQSKGLQYPVVFYWSTSKPSQNDSKKAYRVDEELGIGLKTVLLPHRYTCGNFYFDSIAAKIEREDIEENMRIVYVALTRAKSKMICVDVGKPEQLERTLSLGSIYEKKGNSDLILSSHVDESLLQVNIVDHLEGLKGEEIVGRTYLPIEKYQAKENELMEVSSPSSLEKAMIPAKLNFNKGLRANQRGTLLHRVIEVNKWNDWSKAKLEAQFPEVDSYDVQRLLNWYYHEKTRVLVKGKVEHELPFALIVDNKLMKGYMDFVSIKEKVTLVDFKSDRFVTKEQLMERYHDQIEAYKSALRVMFPDKEVEAYLYSFDLNEYVSMNDEFVI